MSYHLVYAISNRTPPSSTALDAIGNVQEKLNQSITWSNEQLSLVRTRSVTPETPHAVCIEDSFICSSTTVGDGDLWNAHVVVAFLRKISAGHPELVIELRDGGDFVLSKAVRTQAGRFELNQEWLDRERERAVELSGDPRAAAPFFWAEVEAHRGRLFEDCMAYEYGHVPELEDIWELLADRPLSYLAEIIVERTFDEAT